MNDPSDALRIAMAHHQAGRLREAGELYQQILAADPRNAEALHLLGVVDHQNGRHDEAIRKISDAIAIDGGQASYYSNLGEAYRAAGQLDAARGAYLDAIRRQPQQPAFYYNLALVELAQGEPQTAAERCRQALALHPSYAEVHNLLGTVYHNDGRLAEALACYERAIACQGEFVNAHYHRGLILLTQGRWEAGWEEFEWRLRMPGFPVRTFNLPRWSGAELADETLLVHSEQGLGDTLQMARYLPLLRQRCRRVAALVHPPLVPLLRQSGFDDIDSDPAALPRADCQIPMLSLPHVLRTLPENVPSTVPYLSAKPELVAVWRERLRDVTGFRVGICWQGSRVHVSDRARSFPLAALAPLAGVGGVRLVSLQKGEGEEQLSERHGPFNVQELGTDWDETAGPFMDTAAVMQHLDLVITADTATAHLAGALGVPVWVALGARTDWRWMLDRSDTPWYPSMRLFRQARQNDWQELFGRIAEELQVAASHRRRET